MYVTLPPVVGGGGVSIMNCPFHLLKRVVDKKAYVPLPCWGGPLRNAKRLSPNRSLNAWGTQEIAQGA